MEEEEKGRINMEKKKILAILPNNQELQGGFYSAKIYSSDREGKNWLYSGLEGILVLIIDNTVKTKYICMYDPTDFQKCFQYEMYINFEKYLQQLAPDFLCFEIESGFIGLRFESSDDAANFERVVKRIATMQKELFKKAQAKEDHKLQKDIVQNYVKILKENFIENAKKYDEKYAEDGIEISKHRNFKILNNISYDKNKKKFRFGKIPDELKQMFLSFGIKKKDLENDMDFAFTLFKKVIVGLGTENKLKNPALEAIQHNFLPLSETEKLRMKEEEDVRKKMNNKPKSQNKKRQSPKPKHEQPRPKAIKRVSAPLIPTPPPPPPPPPPPSIPSVEPKRPSAFVCIPPPKPRPRPKPKPEKEKILGGGGKNILEDILKKAIDLRRQHIHMHDDDNLDDEDEESDSWDWDNKVNN